MPARPFVDTLNTLRFGQLHDELSVELNKLTAQCAETGRAGTLTLTLKLKPGKAGQVEVIDDIKVKTPTYDRGTTLMFVSPENNLQREDPRQMSLGGLRTVDMETGEIKTVG